MSYQIEGAIIKEQGVTFAVVVVKGHVLQNTTEANNMIIQLTPVFNGIPVVLMAQDARGVPSYYGRKDISKFLANIHINQIPWRKYTVG